MSETAVEPSKRPSWRRRIFIVISLIVFGFALLGFGARWWITTDGGARFIEAQIESRSFGTLQRIEIEALSGDPLSDFTVGEIKLYDEAGHFATLKDLGMVWSPWALRKRHLHIQRFDLKELDLSRRPDLATDGTNKEPSKPFTAQVDKADIAAFVLREPVIGQSAVLKVSGGGQLIKNGTVSGKLDIIRTDAAGDKISLDFKRATSGDLDGTFALLGVPNGTVATLLRAPENSGVLGEGRIQGTTNAGEGQAIIAFGETDAVDATVTWQAAQAELKARLNTSGWPAFDSARQAIGNSLDISAQIDREQTARPFEASARAQNLEANISGELGAEFGLPEQVAFNVQSAQLGAILPLPAEYELGQGRAEGTFIFGDERSASAMIDVNNVVSPYGTLANLSGPLSISQIGDSYQFETKLSAERPVTTMASLPFDLGPKATVTAKGLANLTTRRLTNLDATLKSGGNQTTAKGSITLNGQTLDVSGQANLNLNSIGTLPQGAVETRYRLRKSENSDLAVSANGIFTAKSAFSAPLAGILDDVVAYDIKMVPISGGVRIQEGLIESGGLRLAIAGRATDTLDIESEIALARSVEISALKIEAPSQFSATLTGSRNDPNLRLDGSLQSATLADQTFADLRLRTELTDLITAPKGPVRLTANTSYGPLDLEGRLTSTDAGYAFSDLNVALAKVTAQGDLSLDRQNIATGRLTLVLPQDGDRFARAFVELDNMAGEQGIKLRAEAKNVAYETFAFESVSANVAGTLAALSGELSVKGRRTDSALTREFGFETPLQLTRSTDAGYLLTFSPVADYGRYNIGHSEPLTIEYNAGRISIAAPLTLNGTPVSVNYMRDEASESFRVRARDLSMGLLPLPGRLSESKGQLSINVNARQSEVAGLSGQAVVNVSDWRGLAVDAGNGFTTTATLDLQARDVIWRLENAQKAPFVLSGEGQVPLLTGDRLTALRPDMGRALSGKLTLSGSAKPILGLLTVEDAEPDGTLNAKLDISGTLAAPQVEGQVSGTALRLEVPELGTQFRDGRFKADFTNDTIAVSDVYIRDSKDGTLEGAGQFKLGEFGRPLGRLDVKAKSFRGLDRKDLEGSVSGTLFFKSEAKTSTLGGDVEIKRAELKQFVQGRATVVQIEVEEINGQMEDIEVEARAPAVPIYLDLRVRAPRRIFVRTRGLDVELETDIKLTGTLTEPLLNGTASIVRGGYKIAGKTLDFTEGTVTFNGALPEAKVDLQAETDTQNINAFISITGTVGTPEITLSSKPERPQDEILSALLFGRSMTELSTIEAAQLAGALAQFSGKGGGFDLMGGLRDALGVGQLSIGVGEDGQALISGGRYLAKDVYLQVFRGAGPESTGAVIDWEIQKNIYLRSKVQADSSQSLALKFKKDF